MFSAGTSDGVKAATAYGGKNAKAEAGARKRLKKNGDDAHVKHWFQKLCGSATQFYLLELTLNTPTLLPSDEGSVPWLGSYIF